MTASRPGGNGLFRDDCQSIKRLNLEPSAKRKPTPIPAVLAFLAITTITLAKTTADMRGDPRGTYSRRAAHAVALELAGTRSGMHWQDWVLPGWVVMMTMLCPQFSCASLDSQGSRNDERPGCQNPRPVEDHRQGRK